MTAIGEKKRKGRTWRLGLVCSLVIHAGLYRFVLVTFRPISVAHKPLFVFLGSILEPLEMTLDTARSSGGSPNAAVRGTQVPVSGRNSVFIGKQLEPSKPGYRTGMLPDEKMSLKSSFLKGSGSLNAEKEQNDSKNLGIDPHPPRYVPLRLAL